MSNWRKHRMLAKPAMWVALALALMIFAGINWPSDFGRPRIAAAANTVTVELAEVDTTAGITFQPANVTFDPPSCNVIIRVGDICTDVIAVQNSGIAFTYAIAAWVDANTSDDGDAGPAGDELVECFNVRLSQDTASSPVGDNSAQGPFGPSLLGPGNSATWRLDASVDDSDLCQDLTGTVFLHVSAVGIESPPTATPTNTPVIATATPIPNQVPTEVPSATAVAPTSPPATTVPATTVPATTAPSTPVPTTSVPATTAPSATTPDTTNTPDTNTQNTPAAQPGLTNDVLGDAVTPTATPTLVPSGVASVTPMPVVIPLAVAPGPLAGQDPPPAKVSVGVPQTFLSGVPGLSSISTDIGTMSKNLLLALIALLVLLLATTMFNATLKENSEEFDVVARTFSRSTNILPVAGLLGWMNPGEGQSNFLVSMLKPVVITLLTAGIYAALEPDFGLNNDTIVLFVGLFAGLILTTFLYEGGQVLWSTKRYATPAAMRIYPFAIIIAIGCVFLTKVTGLHPGIIFGFVSAAVVFPRTAMSRRETGMLVLVPLLSLMLISLVSFLLIDPLREFSRDNPGIWGAIPETIAVALFVAGANSALLILVPFTFNDGQRIWMWNKLVWLALALPATFAFFHVILNAGDVDALSSVANQVRLLAFCFLVLAISVATWLYFKLRRRRAAT